MVAFGSNIHIQPLKKSKHEPLYIFLYSESDFSPAHYQSIRPNSDITPSLSLVTQSLSPAPDTNLTAETIQDIPVVLDCGQVQISEEHFESVQVLGMNPVSVLAVQKKKRGKPRGSRNKKQAESSRPSCPDVAEARGRGIGRGRGRGRGRGKSQFLDTTHSPPPTINLTTHSPQVDDSYVDEIRR